jgi:hypothetical protein
MKKFIALAILCVLTACTTNRQLIRGGMLALGMPQSAFLAEWGKPTRQSTTTSEEMMSAGWNEFGGSFFKGKRMFEVWIYEDQKTELVFQRNKRLAAWKTRSTVQELSKPKH